MSRRPANVRTYIHIHMGCAATVFISSLKNRCRNAAIADVVAPFLQERCLGTCSSSLERGTDGTIENFSGCKSRFRTQFLDLILRPTVKLIAQSVQRVFEPCPHGRVSAFAYVMCCAVSHAREVKTTCVPGSKLQGGMSRRGVSFSAKDTRRNPLQKKAGDSTAKGESIIE